MPLLKAAKRYSTLADLKAMLAETLQRNGRLEAAIDSYRGAVNDLVELGIVTRAAYLRIVLAGALLEAGRSREAEWEIKKALPTIGAQRMVPEGFAAIALLRESVKQRRTDPRALLDLRNHLKANS
jgi:hypothetical protein